MPKHLVMCRWCGGTNSDGQPMRHDHGTEHERCHQAECIPREAEAQAAEGARRV